MTRSRGGLVSVVIPAFNEEASVGRTVLAVRQGCPEPAAAGFEPELLVVDDGSRDGTSKEAWLAGASVIRLPLNGGKARALEAGFRAASGDLLLCLDADLGDSAVEAWRLVSEVWSGRADLAVAGLSKPPGAPAGGFGLATAIARAGIRDLTGFTAGYPLSGQRALSRQALRFVLPLSAGWGAEVGMTVDALWAGIRLVETPTAMNHRATGRDPRGFAHRGRQCRDVVTALWRRGWPVSPWLRTAGWRL